MKARLPLSKDIRKLAKDYAVKETERQQKGATRRMIKIFIVAVRRVYGFGFDRILKLVREINNLVQESVTDEIFWYHTDKAVDQLGFDFEHEDYERWDK